ncbi:MAG TPA: GNAT family N-acetyltransferase, partial [Candidatus Sulfotelmatobacter sp.]|nr:GNAT family N-acetyltransferase [Candidatus Sulfotelmatobacter sp.]
QVRRMHVEDFPFAVQLANTMDWNMTEYDFKFNQSLEPDGCFTLLHNHERVGIATCINYGKIGWFGNLVVETKHRGKGAGSFLVNHAVEYLRNKGVESVGIYAYKHLPKFYGDIGFKAQDEFGLFSGQITKATPQDGPQQAHKRDIMPLIEFDRQCFGWNRQKLIEAILCPETNVCYYYASSGKIIGFVMAKVYDEMAEIGPLVSYPNPEVAAKLLSQVLYHLKGLEVYVCIPIDEIGLLESLSTAGLKERFRLTRMFLGSIITQNCVCVPESLERG